MVQEQSVNRSSAVPELSNKQHEAFAQALNNGLSAVDAYETAGFKRIHADAKELAKQPDVVARVEELANIETALSEVEENLTQRMLMDLINPKSIAHADAIMQAYRNMTLARSLGEIGHANKALEMICRLRGLFDNPDLPDEIKKDKRNGKSNSTDRAREDSLQEWTGFAERLGEPPGHSSEAENVSDAEFSEAPY